MSTAFPIIELPDGSKKTARQLTYKETRYVTLRLNETISQAEAARQAGFPAWMCREPGRSIEVGAVAEILAELQGALSEHALEAGLITAAELHEFLTDAIRARISEIRNDDWTYKPISEWPDHWQRLYEGGDVEVRMESARSHDGETKDNAGGWDKTGAQILNVKCKFSSKVKLLELAMKHKAVNAMVEQKSGDVNVLVITAEKARQVVSARKRLAKVIEVKANE